jgi:hypothetical protein
MWALPNRPEPELIYRHHFLTALIWIARKEKYLPLTPHYSTKVSPT